MDTKEREELKLEVLTTICNALNFSLDKTFPSVNALSELLPGKNTDALREAVLELGIEGKVIFQSYPNMGVKHPWDIKLTLCGRSFIEEGKGT